MKTTKLTLKRATGILGVATMTFVSASALQAQTVIIRPPVPPPPPLVVPPPPPVPAATVSVEAVPESYVWDGQEYVGVIGDQYYYLGPGDVWMPMSHERYEYFHDWEHHHHDWREHAIENERYRIDSHGKVHPLKEHHHHHDHDYDHD